MLRILISSLFLAISTGSVTDCSNGVSLFKLTSMSFSPDPTVPGENSTLLLSMNIPQEITAGTVKYSLTYNFIPLTPTIEQLCSQTVLCPIRVGTLDTVSSFPVDPTLSGSLSIRIEWSDPNAVSLLCVAIKTKVG